MKVLILAGLLLFQAPDPENGLPEPGQPAQCDNYIHTPKAHRCECGRAMQKCTSPVDPPEPVMNDKKCKTYCRSQHCECVGTHCGG